MKKCFATLTFITMAVALSLTFGLMNKRATGAQLQITIPSVATALYATDGTTLDVLTPGNSQTFNTIGNFRGLNPGELVGDLDFRPATGQLIGITDQSRLVAISTTDASVTVISTLGTALAGAGFGDIDLNPVANALRIAGGTNAQNYAGTGAQLTQVVQTSFTYAAGDTNAGRQPYIVAGAYTNNYNGAPNTIYYVADEQTDSLATITTVNATGSSNTGGGVLGTIGRIVDQNTGQPVPITGQAAMDCVTDQNLNNTLVLFTAGRLYTIPVNQIPTLQVGQNRTVQARGVPVRSARVNVPYTALAVQSNFNIVNGGGVVAPAPVGQAPAAGNAGGGSCTAVFVTGAFPGGQASNATVTNTGAPISNGFTITLNGFNGTPVNPYNVVLRSQSGGTVTLANQTYNANLGTNQVVNFGFSLQGNTPQRPTSIQLNGVNCSSSTR